MRARLADETGTIRRSAGRTVALVYPSPYHVGMSSLGFQTIYRLLNERPGWACERAFLPDDVEAWRRAKLPLLTLEAERPVGEADVVALSVAYELELAGVAETLSLAGLAPLAAGRNGGP